MGYFYAYGQTTALAAGVEAAIPGAAVLIPEGHRAVVRRVFGFTLDAAITTLFLSEDAITNHIFGTGRFGIGMMGGATFVYVDALAADVNIIASANSATGTPASLVGCAFSGIFQ